MKPHRSHIDQPANPGEWAADAACQGSTALFAVNWNHHQDGIAYRKETARARAVCATCPVLTPCREWALTEPDPAYHMIAGGLDPHERWRIRRAGAA